ncbi:transposase [Streptacidiphilus rugosus]
MGNLLPRIVAHRSSGAALERLKLCCFRQRVAPLLPPAPERCRRLPGRLRIPDRAALAGVMYVLRTGAAWRDVPRRLTLASPE